MWQGLTKWGQMRKNHNFGFSHHKSPLYVASVNVKYLIENATNKKVMGLLVMYPSRSAVSSALCGSDFIFFTIKTHMAIKTTYNK